MKKFAAFFCLVCLVFLSGCDYREIDRGYLVSAIGFSVKEGEVKLYIEAMSSSDVHDKPSERVVLTATGQNLNSAFENIKTSLTKPLYFEQLGAAVFADGVKQEELIFLKNLPNINYGICLVKADDIESLFKAETPNGILGYDIIGLLKTNSVHECRLYRTGRHNFSIPTIRLSEGKMILETTEVKK